MKKETNPTTEHLFETIRNMVTISEICDSLQCSCRNLEKQCREISFDNTHGTGDVLYLTNKFLNALADIELHIHLLHDNYQCEYGTNKDQLIKESCKRYSIPTNKNN